MLEINWQQPLSVFYNDHIPVRTESSLSIEMLHDAMELIKPVIPTFTIVRTEFGIFKVKDGLYGSPSFSDGIPIVDLVDYNRVGRFYERVKALGKKKPRGKRNKTALHVVRNLPPTIEEIRKSLEEVAG